VELKVIQIIKGGSEGVGAKEFVPERSRGNVYDLCPKL
jgi:hypothetical protein